MDILRARLSSWPRDGAAGVTLADQMLEAAGVLLQHWVSFRMGR